MREKEVRKPLLDTLIVASLSIMLATVYRDALISYAETIQVPEYSYLIILLPSSAYLVGELVNRYARIEGLDVARLLASGGGVLIAYSLHNLSRVVVDLSLELELLSIITIIASMLFLVYGDYDNPLIPLAIWLLLLLLIPLPRSIIDNLSAALTGPVARTASMLTGARLVSVYGFTSLRFVDSEGITRTFQVAPECSGVVSLLSILSLTPIIVYLAFTSATKRSKKILAVVFSIITASAIALGGNILRVTLLVYIAEKYSYEEALEFFHQTPSIVYAGIATLAALAIVSRLPQPRREASTKHGPVARHKITGADIAKAAVITLIAVSGMLLAPTSATTSPTQAIPAPEQLTKAPVTILYNNSGAVRAAVAKPSPIIGEALGALAVYRVAVSLNNITLPGWVEIAETPARFHSWFICLTAQHYRILKYWRETINKTTITYILYEKRGITHLLAYAIIKYPTTQTPLYVKITLFTPANTNNYLNKADVLRKALMQINIPRNTGEDLETYIHEAYAGLILLLSAMILGLTHKLLLTRKNPGPKQP